MALIYEELQEELPAAKAPQRRRCLGRGEAKQLLCSVYLAKGDARAAVDMGQRLRSWPSGGLAACHAGLRRRCGGTVSEAEGSA